MQMARLLEWAHKNLGAVVHVVKQFARNLPKADDEQIEVDRATW